MRAQRAQPKASTRARPEQAGGGQQDTANGELETKTNTATGEEWLFQYDVLGNLLSVALPNGDLVEYVIDDMGRRVGKRKNGVLLKQWVYRDALKPVAELDGASNLVAQYAYGSKSNVPDYVRRGTATYRVISDHLGSPRYVVNVVDSTDVPFRADYSSFGEVTGTGLDWMPFGFAGGVYDADGGLVRFGARDFDSLVGRWTVKDPIRFRSGERSFYVYVGNNPVNGLDPRGLASGAEYGICALCQASRTFITGACISGIGTAGGLIAGGVTLAICATMCASTLEDLLPPYGVVPELPPGPNPNAEPEPPSPPNPDPGGGGGMCEPERNQCGG